MRSSLILAWAAVATGCIGNGTEIGNPGATTTTAKVGLSAFSSDAAFVTIPPPDMPADPGSAVEVNEAWVSVHEMELVRSRACGGTSTAARLTLKNLVGDLAQGPLLAELEVPVTDYCKVKVEIQKPEDQAGPNPLGENTIQINGVRGDGIPFDIATSREYELQLSSRSSGFAIDTKRSALVVAFDVKRWFDTVDLSTATVNGEGEGAHIQIDRTHNAPLLAEFEASVSRSLGVYRDRDEDGRVNDDEYEDQLADDGGE